MEPAGELSLVEVKRRFTSASVLILHDHKQQFVVEVDPSDVGIGIILSQRSANRLHPCAYLSLRLNSAERYYDVGDWELLTIRWIMSLTRGTWDPIPCQPSALALARCIWAQAWFWCAGSLITSCKRIGTATGWGKGSGCRPARFPSKLNPACRCPALLALSMCIRLSTWCSSHWRSLGSCGCTLPSTSARSSQFCSVLRFI